MSSKQKHRARVTPRCIVIAGPNGAGKTTFAREFLPKDTDVIHFVNADIIGIGLRGSVYGSARPISRCSACSESQTRCGTTSQETTSCGVSREAGLTLSTCISRWPTLGRCTIIRLKHRDCWSTGHDNCETTKEQHERRVLSGSWTSASTVGAPRAHDCPNAWDFDLRC
jgi:hypothetical protein